MQIKRKYKYKKGTNLIEIGIITVGVFLVGYFSFTLFGGSVANIFQSKDSLDMLESNSSRVAIPTANSSLLTNTDLNLNNKALKTPIETYIRKTAGGGRLVETNGAAGNINDLAYIAKEYTAQIMDVAKTTNVNTSGLSNALKLFNSNIDEYIEKDQALVADTDDPLLKIINELDFAVDLSKDGSVATLLSDELNKVLDQLPASSEKILLETYTKDLLHMGEKLTYSIDSREQELLEEVITDEVQQVNNDIIDYNLLAQGGDRLERLAATIIKDRGKINTTDDFEFFDRMLRDYLDEAEFDLVSYSENTVEYDIPNVVDKTSSNINPATELMNGWMKFANGQELYMGSSDSKNNTITLWLTNNPVDPTNLTIGVDVFGFKVFPDGIYPMGSPGSPDQGTCDTTGWGCTYEFINNSSATQQNTTTSTSANLRMLKSLKTKLEDLYNDPNISKEEKDDIAKKVSVYLEGNYYEVFNGSYNNNALCSSLNGDIKNNKCVLDSKAANAKRTINTKNKDDASDTEKFHNSDNSVNKYRDSDDDAYDSEKSLDDDDEKSNDPSQSYYYKEEIKWKSVD